MAGSAGTARRILSMRGRSQNPLPCTQGRGPGEGTAIRRKAYLAGRRTGPLAPTLCPEYRGEGEGAAGSIPLYITRLQVERDLSRRFAVAFGGGLFIFRFTAGGGDR